MAPVADLRLAEANVALPDLPAGERQEVLDGYRIELIDRSGS